MGPLTRFSKSSLPKISREIATSLATAEQKRTVGVKRLCSGYEDISSDSVTLDQFRTLFVLLSLAEAVSGLMAVVELTIASFGVRIYGAEV